MYNQTFESVAEYIKRTNKWKTEHPIKEQTFEEQVELMQNQRHRKEYNEYKQKERNGEYIYTHFCIWCNGYANEKTRTDTKAFAIWLKEQGIELTQHQRRYLLEHKFGYKVWYDEKEKDWRCEKVASAT